jgi:hypothetical protein
MAGGGTKAGAVGRWVGGHLGVMVTGCGVIRRALGWLGMVEGHVIDDLDPVTDRMWLGVPYKQGWCLLWSPSLAHAST